MVLELREAGRWIRMSMHHETKPASVSCENTTKQVGETKTWVERVVWTDRMLQTLETEVKGGKWFSLIDKVYSKRTLEVSFKKVRRNKGACGVDHVSIAQFEKQLSDEIEKLHNCLRDGSYVPQNIKRVFIPKPGTSKKRPLGIPTVRDRVVQTALRAVMEPIFEREFHDCSYGFRPQRDCKDALRVVDSSLKDGYLWVVDIDFESYFDTIPHQLLLQKVNEKITDKRLLHLIESYLKQDVLTDAGCWTPEAGCPQGAVISPLLSNIYLNPLDHFMANHYFKHSHKYAFNEIDGWVRMRLRSILRKRMKKRGRGRGADHQRWPNAYFSEIGLFSTHEARLELLQSSMR